MDTALARRRRSARRLGYGGLALGLLALAVAAAATRGTSYWLVVLAALAPDLPLLLGVGRGLERGRIHPRAVPLYNAVHRFWGPAAVGVVALAASFSPAYVVALAWAFHVALDRAVGYGLRTRDGFQRA